MCENVNWLGLLVSLLLITWFGFSIIEIIGWYERRNETVFWGAEEFLIKFILWAEIKTKKVMDKWYLRIIYPIVWFTYQIFIVIVLVVGVPLSAIWYYINFIKKG